MVPVPTLASVSVLVSVIVFWAPRTAEANAVLVNWGTSIAHIQDLPVAVAAKFERETARRVALGYCYSSAGVFGFDLWTWGGRYCLYDGRSSADISEPDAREIMASAGSELESPFLYRFPAGLLVIGVILTIGVPPAIVLRKLRNRPSPPTSLLSA